MKYQGEFKARPIEGSPPKQEAGTSQPAKEVRVGTQPQLQVPTHQPAFGDEERPHLDAHAAGSALDGSHEGHHGTGEANPPGAPVAPERFKRLGAYSSPHTFSSGQLDIGQAPPSSSRSDANFLTQPDFADEDPASQGEWPAQGTVSRLLAYFTNAQRATNSQSGTSVKGSNVRSRPSVSTTSAEKGIVHQQDEALDPPSLLKPAASSAPGRDHTGSSRVGRGTPVALSEEAEQHHRTPTIESARAPEIASATSELRTSQPVPGETMSSLSHSKRDGHHGGPGAHADAQPGSTGDADRRPDHNPPPGRSSVEGNTDLSDYQLPSSDIPAPTLLFASTQADAPPLAPSRVTNPSDSGITIATPQTLDQPVALTSPHPLSASGQFSLGKVGSAALPLGTAPSVEPLDAEEGNTLLEEWPAQGTVSQLRAYYSKAQRAKQPSSPPGDTSRESNASMPSSPAATAAKWPERPQWKVTQNYPTQLDPVAVGGSKQSKTPNIPSATPPVAGTQRMNTAILSPGLPLGSGDDVPALDIPPRGAPEGTHIPIATPTEIPREPQSESAENAVQPVAQAEVRVGATMDPVAPLDAEQTRGPVDSPTAPAPPIYNISPTASSAVISPSGSSQGGPIIETAEDPKESILRVEPTPRVPVAAEPSGHGVKDAEACADFIPTEGPLEPEKDRRHSRPDLFDHLSQPTPKNVTEVVDSSSTHAAPTLIPIVAPSSPIPIISGHAVSGATSPPPGPKVPAHSLSPTTIHPANLRETGQHWRTPTSGLDLPSSQPVSDWRVRLHGISSNSSTNFHPISLQTSAGTQSSPLDAAPEDEFLPSNDDVIPSLPDSKTDEFESPPVSATPGGLPPSPKTEGPARAMEGTAHSTAFPHLTSPPLQSPARVSEKSSPNVEASPGRIWSSDDRSPMPRIPSKVEDPAKPVCDTESSNDKANSARPAWNPTHNDPEVDVERHDQRSHARRGARIATATTSSPSVTEPNPHNMRPNHSPIRDPRDLRNTGSPVHGAALGTVKAPSPSLPFPTDVSTEAPIPPSSASVLGQDSVRDGAHHPMPKLGIHEAQDAARPLHSTGATDVDWAVSGEVETHDTPPTSVGHIVRDHDPTTPAAFSPTEVSSGPAVPERAAVPPGEGPGLLDIAPWQGPPPDFEVRGTSPFSGHTSDRVYPNREPTPENSKLGLDSNQPTTPSSHHANPGVRTPVLAPSSRANPPDLPSYPLPPPQHPLSIGGYPTPDTNIPLQNSTSRTGFSPASPSQQNGPGDVDDLGQPAPVSTTHPSVQAESGHRGRNGDMDSRIEDTAVFEDTTDRPNLPTPSPGPSPTIVGGSTESRTEEAVSPVSLSPPDNVKIGMLGPVQHRPNGPVPLNTFHTSGNNLVVGFMGAIQAGGNVTMAPRTVVYTNSDDGEWPRNFLSHVAPNAIHTSEAVLSIGRCDEGTRIQLLARITDWVHDENLCSQTLCMTGAAGSGKSSIALTIAQECSQRCTLAAAFFFSSSDDTRKDCSRVISTIAYQLGLQNPSLRDAITDAVSIDPLVFNTSLATQANKLLLGPLHKGGLHSIPGLILLDGIDECVEEEQSRLMGVAKSILQATSFRVFITGRPEVVIRRELEPGGLLDPSYHIRLSDDKEFDATEDIRQSLLIHLPKLTKQQAHELEDCIEAIVQASSGQYIYPATVIKYVQQGTLRGDRPKKRLASVHGWIRAPTGAARALSYVLSALDQLYRNILVAAVKAHANDTPENGEKKKEIVLITRAFASLQIFTVPQVDTQSDSIHDQLLGLEEGTLYSATCDLRSLVRIREPKEAGKIVQFYHRTCLEFLQDFERSGKDGEEVHFPEDRLVSYLVKRLGYGFSSSANSASANVTPGGSFATDEAAWVNCTSASLLGRVLRSATESKAIRTALMRFAKVQGWKKLEEWIDLVKKHPHLAKAEPIEAALLDWKHSLDMLQKSEVSGIASASKKVLVNLSV